MRTADTSPVEGGIRSRWAVLWALPVAILLVVWLWLSFSSGGFVPRTWLAGSLVLGLFGLVAAWLVLYPRRPRQLSLVVLVCFALYAVWVACSATWAVSSSLAWLEAARTFTYLLLFALALVFLTHPAARSAFRYLLLAASLFLVLFGIFRLWSAADLAALFSQGRLIYPVSYSNGTAALYLILFWPMVWLAVDSRGRAPIRGLALGVASVLLALGFLTQSRGAFWSLAITVPIMFLLSPARLKTLLYLLVPSLLMIWAAPQLNDYWQVGPEQLGGAIAGRVLLVFVITSSFIGMILSLLERWVNVTRRMRLVFGITVLLVAAGLTVFGAIRLTENSGGPLKWITDTQNQFIEGETPHGGGVGYDSSAETRLLAVSSSGRVEIWKMAWLDFTERPWLGKGAGSFVFTFDRLGQEEISGVSQPHSWELQILAETGIVGGIFGFFGVVVIIIGLIWPRSMAVRRRLRLSKPRQNTPLSKQSLPASELSTTPRRCSPSDYGWEMALLVGVLYFLIHGSLEWLWQIAAVAMPALLMVAAGLSEVDARKGVMWPRLARWTIFRKTLSSSGGEPSNGSPPEGTATPSNTEHTESPDRLLRPERRRAKYYERRLRRRERRAKRRERVRSALIPQGPLSRVFRVLIGVISLALIVWAGLPYLSLNLQDSALGSAVSNPGRALTYTRLAAQLVPRDPEPYKAQAYVYGAAATTAAYSARVDRAGAVLDNLSLSIGSLTKAINREPADWSLRYSAAIAVLNLLLASDSVEGRYISLPQEAIPGLIDWSSVAPGAGSGDNSLLALAPGLASGSLAASKDELRTVADYRRLSRTQLWDLADGYLTEARERHPISSQITAAAKFLATLIQE